MIQAYGPDGMSSEESDNEGEEIQPLLRVKVMPWRRNISHELGIIDKQCKIAGSFHNQGSKPMRRERRAGNAAVSSRPPVPDLPKALYDQEWWNGLDDMERALVSVNEEVFEWVRIAEAGPNVL